MNPLTQLILATASFVGFHFLLSHPLRASLVRRLGETAFLGFYSLIAAASMGWMIWAARSMPSMPPHWIAAPWFFDWAAPILMLISMVLLAGSFLGNPAFPDPMGKSRPIRPVTGVFAITRHPMNWAFIIWALTHIALSGGPANLVIASGVLVLTFFGSIGQDRKKEALMGEAWRGWEARTSFIPFGAIADGRIPLRAAWPGVVPLVLGLMLWFGASWLHGMPVGPVAWLG